MSRPYRTRCLVSLLAAAGTALPVAAGLLGGCHEGTGTLRCSDGPCTVLDAGFRPDGGGGGHLPLEDGGGSGGGPKDLDAPRPDLPRPDVDLAGLDDLGSLCSGGAWPRAHRSGLSPSGGSGGSIGDSELQVSAAGAPAPVIVHVPDCPQPGAPVYGLVVALHDVDGNRDYLRFKWLQAAAERGYVLALPLAAASYGGERNWLENQENNRDLVLRTVRALEELYDIAQKETLLTGLGAGATFAALLAAAEETQPFEGVLLVNGTLWDPALEGRGVMSFIVLGTSDARVLRERDSSVLFRYLYVPELGPYYPGPAWAALPGDREVADIDPTRASDWFWP